jgi:outer membrane protein assembly factor BamB
MWIDFRNSPDNNCVCNVSAFASAKDDLSPYKVHLGGMIWGSAIHDDKCTYVGTTNRRFYCIQDDKIKWTYKLKVKNDSLIDSAATLHPVGLVIVPGGDGFLHALDKETGKVAWTFKAHHVPDNVDSTGAIVNSFEGNVTIDKYGRIYAGCDNSYMYCLDHTGRELWSHGTNMMIWTCICVFGDSQYIAYGSLDFHIYIHEVQTGKLIAKLNTGAEVKASIICIGDHYLVACNSNGQILCWDVTRMSDTPQQLWKVDCGKEIYSTPVAFANTIVACTMDGRVVGHDIHTGKRLWSNIINSPICSSPLVTTDGLVLFGASDGCLYAITIDRGLLVFKHNLCGRKFKCALNASPTIDSKGNVVIGSYDGNLYFTPYKWIVKNLKQVQNEYHGKNGIVLETSSNTKHIIQIKMVKVHHGHPDPDAALSAQSIAFPKQVENLYDIDVSSDGHYINLIPKDSAYLKDRSEVVADVQARYYIQSGNWFKDRLNIFGDHAFQAQCSIPRFPTKSHAVHLPNVMKFEISGLYVHQPSILDTYIPAALDAQGFVCIALGTNSPQFPIVCMPAIPDLDGFVMDMDVSKTLVMKGTLRNGIMHAENKDIFTISAMGGTIPFKKFCMFADIEERSGEFYADAFCPSIKGNNDDYKFSSEIIPQLCDYRMKLKAIGTFDITPYDPFTQVSPFAARNVSNNKWAINIHDQKRHIITVILYKEANVNVMIKHHITANPVTIEILPNKYGFDKYVLLVDDKFVATS